jgi:polyphenol oxidase
VSFLLIDSVFSSTLLDEFAWLEHGFGTRAFVHPPEVRTLKQVHSSRVVEIHDHVAGLQADALVSDISGATVGVRTADCVPILLADPRQRVVAAVHAGWRGTASGIVLEAIRAMTEAHGACVGDIRIAIGPSIGACCYEVGDEVAAGFRAILPESASRNGKTMLDLREANRRLAVSAGVPAQQIDVASLCTRCNPELFHSFRRDKDACGRLLSFIGVRA